MTVIAICAMILGVSALQQYFRHREKQSVYAILTAKIEKLSELAEEGYDVSFPEPEIEPPEGKVDFSEFLAMKVAKAPEMIEIKEANGRVREVPREQLEFMY